MIREINFYCWESWCVCAIHKIGTRVPTFTKLIVVLVKIFIWEVPEFIGVWIQTFVCYNPWMILLLLYCIIYCVLVWWDRFHIQMVWVHEFWDVYYNKKNYLRHCPVHYEFSYIDFSRCLSCTTSFIFMLKTVKKGCSNHVVDNSVIKFILTIEPWCTSTSILQGYVKLINKKVSKICWFFQSAILIHSHKLAWMLLVIPCCQDEAYDSE